MYDLMAMQYQFYANPIGKRKNIFIPKLMEMMIASITVYKTVPHLLVKLDGHDTND